MRILLNDYSGHAFTVELARELASRGHDVLHLYSRDFQTPKGDLVRGPTDPTTFNVEGLSIGKTFQKYDFFARRWQELGYGKLVCRRIETWNPDVVIGCNNPLDAQRLIQNCCMRRHIPFVFWLQDIYSAAIKSVLSKKIPILGYAIGTWYEELEKRLLRRSNQIVAITEDFVPPLVAWKVRRDRITVVENWAPKDKIVAVPRDNSWSRAQNLSNQRVLMYTGTLGLKHNPDLLLAAAAAFQSEPDVRIVVTSEGKYADYVKCEAEARGLTNLVVLPFQSFRDYSEVLATSDVTLAMIETDAASYSVPSKVLSYLCAGKAIVLAAHTSNLAAKILRRSGAGIVVAPRDGAGFEAAIRRLLTDAKARHEAESRARSYAEQHFDIGTIAWTFEKILASSGTASQLRMQSA
jgi:colanic acid biosynthesis glycosyl transferase WcaI